MTILLAGRNNTFPAGADFVVVPEKFDVKATNTKSLSDGSRTTSPGPDRQPALSNRAGLAKLSAEWRRTGPPVQWANGPLGFGASVDDGAPDKPGFQRLEETSRPSHSYGNLAVPGWRTTHAGARGKVPVDLGSAAL